MSTLSTLAKDCFTPLASMLSIPERLSVKKTCTNAYLGITAAQAAPQMLDLLNEKVTGQYLVTIIHLYPTIIGLKLSLDRITKTEMTWFVAHPTIKKIQFLTLQLTDTCLVSENDQLDKDGLYDLLERLHYPTLRTLDACLPSLGPAPIPFVAARLQTCDQLRSFRLHFGPALEDEISHLLRQVPPTLEEMGPFEIFEVPDLNNDYPAHPFVLTDELADLLMEKLNPSLIKKCSLNVEKLSPEKLLQLLEFLPLKMMTHISLDGIFFTYSSIHHFTDQIKKNTVLKELILKFQPDCYRICGPDLESILKSLFSSDLQSLNMSYRGFTTKESLKKCIVNQTPFLPSLKTINITIFQWNPFFEVFEAENLSRNDLT